MSKLGTEFLSWMVFQSGQRDRPAIMRLGGSRYSYPLDCLFSTATVFR